MQCPVCSDRDRPLPTVCPVCGGTRVVNVSSPHRPSQTPAPETAGSRVTHIGMIHDVASPDDEVADDREPQQLDRPADQPEAASRQGASAPWWPSTRVEMEIAGAAFARGAAAAGARNRSTTIRDTAIAGALGFMLALALAPLIYGWLA